MYTNAFVSGTPSTGPPAAIPTVLYVLTDPQASVVGLTDIAGHLVARYDYTPFGALLDVENHGGAASGSAFCTPPPILTSLAPASASATLFDNSHARLAAQSNRIGHQGLRFERLDRPWTSPLNGGDIGTGASAAADNPFGAFTGQYHNRARMYAPEWGRFTTRDPNGLGGPFTGSLWHSGQSPTAISPQFDLTSHFADGMNTHVAYAGNPLGRRDPTGMFMSPADIAGIGVMGVVRGLRGGLQGMVSEYASNQEHDLDWALDWNMPDDWHTRGDNGWVSEAWDNGVRGGLQDWVSEDVLMGLGPDTSDVQMAGSFAGGVGRPTKAWRQVARGINSVGYVAHHVVSYYKHSASRMAELHATYGKFNFNYHAVNSLTSNMVGLTQAAHGRGRHTAAYTRRVFDSLRNALETMAKNNPNYSPADAERTVYAEIRKIAQSIQSNPGWWFAP